ncbi:MAG: hypothetical protein ACLFN8_03230 [Candidatus Woesearchaeota archaeon]
MKDGNWTDCITNNSARKISPDVIRAKSLKETACDRINLITEINKKKLQLRL